MRDIRPAGPVSGSPLVIPPGRPTTATILPDCCYPRSPTSLLDVPGHARTGGSASHV